MTKKEIADVLRGIRIKSGLTQEEAAKKIGRRQQTIASWESAQAQPDANTLFLLCNVYGTSVDEAFGFKSKINELTALEFEHIKKYRTLDEHGKKIIDLVLEELNSRDEAEKSPLLQIDLYDLPASAGIGEPLEGEYRTLIEVPDTPLNRKADYCVRITGNSMEPTYKDGNIVLVKKGQVHIGDVGIFILDGESFIKELGEGKLISHNSKYSDLRLEDFNNIYIAGKVIGVI